MHAYRSFLLAFIFVLTRGRGREMVMSTLQGRQVQEECQGLGSPDSEHRVYSLPIIPSLFLLCHSVHIEVIFRMTENGLQMCMTFLYPRLHTGPPKQPPHSLLLCLELSAFTTSAPPSASRAITSGRLSLTHPLITAAETPQHPSPIFSPI